MEPEIERLIVPDTLPLVAVIVALPVVSPVTRPLRETDATAGALVDHVRRGLLIGAPEGSLTMAETCRVWPTATDVDDALRLIVATTGAVDTNVALPDLPSTVPVIEAIPLPTAVTRPAFEIVATAGFELLHDTTRPGIVVPRESAAVAVARVVSPTLRLELPSTTPTVATVAGATVCGAEPLIPSTVAVIVAAPAVTPVTRPVDETEAMFGALVFHSTMRPVIACPSESRASAPACTDWPGTMRAAPRVTTTAETIAGLMVTTVCPILPLEPPRPLPFPVAGR